jgi:phage virion morphogenesis protein
MAGASVTFDMRELDGVRAMLQKAALSPADRDKLLDGVGLVVQGQTENRFDSRIDPEGNTWKALAQKTQDYYNEKVKGKRSLLVGEGDLRGSITYEKSGWSVLVGSAKEYAAIHQFGGDIRPKTKPVLFVPGYGYLKKVTIPARPYLGVSAENAAELAVEIQHYLASRLA